MFQELTTSLKASLYERTSSPLMGSVLVAWLGFNWKPLLYMMFSGSGIEEKLNFVTENYLDVWNNLFWPIIVGGLLSLVYPVLSYVPFWISEQIQHAQRNLKQKLSMSQLLSVDQSLNLREELIEKDKKIRGILSDNQSQKDELEATIKQLTQENKELYFKLSELDVPDPKADPQKIELSQLEYEILNHHTGLQQGHVQIAKDIASKLDLSVDDVQKALEELEKRGFIKYVSKAEDDEGNDHPGYNLDILGRKYLAYRKGSSSASKA